ncbi:MAG TPA: ferredoxin [Pseudonocardiaceae bacterium]|jgi:NAD-dependent dihydropyrimidine dehydrogenase PreA subunit|nr:ferredoxin [Pseudonocardiaceae bacterium]
MTYVIAQPCTDVKDRNCLRQCPVDCIYEGARALYINPDECIECGACEPACPVGAVYHDADLPAELSPAVDSNRNFFAVPLPGRDEPLGNPGGAHHIGPIDADTAHVAALPVR